VHPTTAFDKLLVEAKQLLEAKNQCDPNALERMVTLVVRDGDDSAAVIERVRAHSR